ncbi:hypothetical protein FRB99_000049 [Tulasnella sp. 403]|nr:hypothetical protein FRB99_000049 [Tulasnella sp. 403]
MSQHPGMPQHPGSQPSGSQRPMQAAPGHMISDVVGSFEGMQFRIDHRDSNTLLVLNLQPGYVMKALSGTMVAMAGSVQIKGKYKITMKKLLLGGEITESQFTGPGEVMLAPDIWGDVAPIRLDGRTTWFMSKEAFLASSQGIELKSKSQGIMKGILSDEGIFVYQLLGAGILFLQSLGAIIQKRLAPGEEWVVDNGHLVAWSAQYKMEYIKAGGFWSGDATDEGMVCRFTGPGIVYIQTRNPKNLVGWISAQMPAQY